jgi:hypothetical protein
MPRRSASAQTGQAAFTEGINVMLKSLTDKSGKEKIVGVELKKFSVELAKAAKAEMKNVMESLANGNEFMTLVELKELCQTTKDEMTKKGMAGVYMFSCFPRVEKDLDRFITGDEFMIPRVPIWPKNKDELVKDYNDTWKCFDCTHIPRKVTRKEWKVARVQVRNGIFYPIVDHADQPDQPIIVYDMDNPSQSVVTVLNISVRDFLTLCD